MSTVPGDDRLEAETGAGAAAPSPKPEGAPKRTTRRKEGSGTGRRTRAAATQGAGATASDGAATAVAEATEKPEMPRPRLLEEFKAQIVPAMVKEFEYGNVMEVPRLTKVVLNIGLGEALTNPRAIETAIQDLTTISGQKPVVTRARKSIAGFKLREGNPIGVTVTLRGVRMYHFMDRLLNMALPRIRDFRGVSPSSFDGRGNYSLGIREQIIFPEIDYGQIERIRGFQVTIGTTAKTDAEALRLLALMGMPFARQE